MQNLQRLLPVHLHVLAVFIVVHSKTWDSNFEVNSFQ